MAAFAYATCLGWVFLSLYLFSGPDKRRALLQVVIFGWLFLPVMRLIAVIPGEPLALSFPGLKFTKLNTIAYAVLAGGLVYDRARWLSVRPRWIDLPMALWCLCPLASSLTNDLGWYDGFSSTLDQVMTWGVLYWAGRVYFHSLDDYRELVTWFLRGAVVYLPLCWLELRLSPQLHHMLYGYHQHEFLQSVRWGGYRPMAFLPHPLVVAMWTVTAALVAFWMWRCRALPSITGLVPSSIPLAWAFGLLAMTAVTCRSMGALALGTLGAVALTLSRGFRSAVLLALLLFLPPIYIGVRASGTWTGEDFVAWLGETVSQERAESLSFRLKNENLLVDKALERPAFGWGGWGRSRVYDIWGNDISVTDGGWIIALGERGWFGLAAWVIAMLLPTARFLRDVPPRLWSHPQVAPLAAMAVVFALSTCNNLLNVDTDPVYLLGMGALVSVVEALTVKQPEAAAKARTAMPAKPALVPQVAASAS